jgi:hypothetical protein
MSEQEKEIPEIKEIEDIFKFLTEEEPTPDDEIEAREKLIDKFSSLISEDSLESHRDQLRTIQEKLMDWDTLDLWFVETDLPKLIKKSLEDFKSKEKVVQEDITEKEEEKTKTERISEEFDKLERDLEEKITSEGKIDIDIDEIVTKISHKFKGEIDDLKSRVTSLQEELEKKSNQLNKMDKAKRVQKIKPLKEPRLKPPEIHIPTIKKIQKSKKELEEKFPSEGRPKPPEGEISIKQKTKEDKIDPDSIEIEEETQKEDRKEEKLKEKDKVEEIGLKSKSETDDLRREKPKPKLDVKVEIPKVKTKTDQNEEESRLTPRPLNIIEEKKKPPKPPASVHKEDDEITPIPKKPKITTIATEEPSKLEMKEDYAKQKPFIKEKPKISQVKVEETESKSVEPKSTDLFSMFSPRSGNSREKEKHVPRFIPFSNKSSSAESSKATNLLETSKREKSKSSSDTIEGESTSTAKNFTEETESLTKIEDLPRNKDVLYQELIALEGKRYSIEKRFKTLEKSYQKGNINDIDFKDRGEGLKENLDDITDRITKIRRLIASL